MVQLIGIKNNIKGAESGLKIRKTPKGNIYEKYFRNNKD